MLAFPVFESHVHETSSNGHNDYINPRAYVRGKANNIVIVIVISTKIARCQVLGICACCKYSQSIDIVEKLVLNVE